VSALTLKTMSDADVENAARAAKLQAMQDGVTDAGNNVRALKVRGLAWPRGNKNN
jgi:hypothetical protein